MDDYLLAVGSRMKYSTGGYSMDDHKDILHAGLQPGLESAVGAFDAADLAVVDQIKKGLVSSGRWFELRRFGRIDFERVVEVGWLRTEILAQLQMLQKHYLLSAETRQYLDHSAAIADHSFRKCCSDECFAELLRCSMRICRLTQTSNRRVEAGSVAEPDLDPGK